MNRRNLLTAMAAIPLAIAAAFTRKGKAESTAADLTAESLKEAINAIETLRPSQKIGIHPAYDWAIDIPDFHEVPLKVGAHGAAWRNEKWETVIWNGAEWVEEKLYQQEQATSA